jgi:hypothetical protein
MIAIGHPTSSGVNTHAADWPGSWKNVTPLNVVLLAVATPVAGVPM